MNVKLDSMFGIVTSDENSLYQGTELPKLHIWLMHIYT